MHTREHFEIQSANLRAEMNHARDTRNSRLVTDPTKERLDRIEHLLEQVLRVAQNNARNQKELTKVVRQLMEMRG